MQRSNQGMNSICTNIKKHVVGERCFDEGFGEFEALTIPLSADDNPVKKNDIGTRFVNVIDPRVSMEGGFSNGWVVLFTYALQLGHYGKEKDMGSTERRQYAVRWYAMCVLCTTIFMIQIPYNPPYIGPHGHLSKNPRRATVGTLGLVRVVVRPDQPPRTAPERPIAYASQDGISPCLLPGAGRGALGQVCHYTYVYIVNTAR